jgi:hypothetical protein
MALKVVKTERLKDKKLLNRGQILNLSPDKQKT